MAMIARRRRTLLDRMHRVARFRLLVPLKRSRHPPEYTARGVLIGLWWAFTPLVGVQMTTVLGTWLLLRWWRRTDFNLVVGLAWTWVTNVFTMWPTYYGFYITGQFMLGRWDDLSGYDAFTALLDEAFRPGMGMWESLVTSFELVAKEQGLAMTVGCLPWSFGLAWLGYVWSVKYLNARQSARLRRFRENTVRHRATGVLPEDTPPAADGDGQAAR